MTEFRIRKHFRRKNRTEIDEYFTVEEYRLGWDFFLRIIPFRKTYSWYTVTEQNCGMDGCWTSDKTFSWEKMAKEWVKTECEARQLVIPKSEIVETLKCQEQD